MIKLKGIEKQKTRRNFNMAKKVTEKKPLFGNLRSHACNAVRHAQKPNLQRVKMDNGETILMSARELRTLKKATN